MAWGRWMDNTKLNGHQLKLSWQILVTCIWIRELHSRGYSRCLHLMWPWQTTRQVHEGKTSCSGDCPELTITRESKNSGQPFFFFFILQDVSEAGSLLCKIAVIYFLISISAGSGKNALHTLSVTSFYFLCAYFMAWIAWNPDLPKVGIVTLNGGHVV